uniref:Sushi, nidogen and EGF-like domain-containing protein 1 n=1 Tax=Magallana gigas TaxID=29159 RepID=K1QP89_MAGGI
MAVFALYNYSCKEKINCGIPDQKGINLSSIKREDAIGLHRRIHASCADGYSQSGSGRLNCQSNGEWKYNIVCEDVDECQEDPCLNGAKCTNTPGSFTCTCDAGWTGIVCDEDVDECQKDPCLNGAECTNTPGSFTCTCNAGWTGKLCNEVLPNIALRKPAEQSSTKLDYIASYAVDGNRGTDVGVEKCTVTGDGDTSPWWRVDLQALYSITSVRILNRGIDQYNTGLASKTLTRSGRRPDATADDVSEQLRDVTVTVGLTESNVNTPCGFFAGPGTASQLVVINFLPNIALGKSAKQSSTKSDHNASYAVDGNRGTTFLVDRCTHTDDGDINPWWRVDLQAVYNITSVRILNRGKDQYDDMSSRLQDVNVTVGLTESDVNTPCGFFAGPGTLSQLVVIHCPTSTLGRFVKISKITEALTLCEVDVFGVPV